MYRRETHVNKGLTVRLFIASVALVCASALAACDDGLEPGQQMPPASNFDAGERKDGGTTTSSNPSTARDGGGGDGSRPMGGSMNGGGMPSGGNASGGAAMGGATGGGAGTGADGGTPASVQVAAACMGHGGETVCDGLNLIRCGMAGNAESTTPCMSEARCRAGLMTGKCGSCDPGAAHCNGAELQECNANGEFVMKAPCPSVELCSEMNKSCNPMQCGADSVKCENGFLKRCKPDLTGYDMGMQCMSPTLCSEIDKRCNECMPNTKACVEDTLETCGADGKGPMRTPCSGTTPHCLKDKCVQCKMDAHCMTTTDCRVAKCNVATGMCMEEVAQRGTRCAGGSRYCDALGGCQQCLEDSHCSNSQYCPLYSCVDRAPLTVSSLLGCSLTVNAGFALYADSISASPGSSSASITAQFTQLFIPTAELHSGTPQGSSARAFLPSSSSGPRTFSVSASWTDGTMMSGSATCSAQQVTTSSATLTFSGGGGMLTARITARM